MSKPENSPLSTPSNPPLLSDTKHTIQHWRRSWTASSTILNSMASATVSIAAAVRDAVATATASSLAETSTPVQGPLGSAGQGISGGITGDSLSLKIICGCFFGIALYNACELIVRILATFNKYKGLYFWSLMVASFGIIPYSIGFLIKFFELLDPDKDVGYVAIVVLTFGWYAMITGQSFVLWSRLHIVTNSRRIINYTLWMIIIDGILLHPTTTVLTFGANSNDMSPRVLNRFIYGYNVMEKIQMIGFFLQELIISVIYIKETMRLLKLSESVKGEIESVVDIKSTHARRTMYQLISINAIIIAMDIVLLGVEFANLYLIQITLKGAMYSIKLKLEFAVLGKLVQIARNRNNSGNFASCSGGRRPGPRPLQERSPSDPEAWPDFVDPRRIGSDVTHADSSVDRSPGSKDEAWESMESERWKKRARAHCSSWIDEEMDKHNIG